MSKVDDEFVIWRFQILENSSLPSLGNIVLLKGDIEIDLEKHRNAVSFKTE